MAKVTPAGALSIFAGRTNGAAGQPTTGTATNSRLNGPTGVATDTAGDLYIADTANNRVRQVAAAQPVPAVAGAPLLVYGGLALVGLFGVGALSAKRRRSVSYAGGWPERRHRKDIA